MRVCCLYNVPDLCVKEGGGREEGRRREGGRREGGRREGGGGGGGGGDERPKQPEFTCHELYLVGQLWRCAN